MQKMVLIQGTLRPSVLCQSRVSGVTLQKDCKRPVHQHCVSVTVYKSKILTF